MRLGAGIYFSESTLLMLVKMSSSSHAAAKFGVAERPLLTSGARHGSQAAILPAGVVDHRVAVLVAIAWVQAAIAPFVFVVVDRLHPLASPALAVAVAVLLAAYGLGPILSRLRPWDFFFTVVVGSAFLFSALLHPLTRESLLSIAPTFFLTAFPLYFLGRAVGDYSTTIVYSYRVSIIAVVINAGYTLSYLASGRVLGPDNMDAAYRLLPAVLITCLIAVSRGGLARWMVAILAATLLIAQGTRGPLVCLGVLVVLYWLFQTGKSPWGWVVAGGLVVAVGWLPLSIDEFLKQLALWLDRVGLSGRAISMARENAFAEANGRDAIYGQVWEGIARHPVLGNGVGGDRLLARGDYYEGGTYAHNFVLEVLAQFGYLAGGAILLAVCLVVVRALFRSNGAERAFVLACLAVCVKLLMSGSYLNEPFFFLLLGCCFSLGSSRSAGSVPGARPASGTWKV